MNIKPAGDDRYELQASKSELELLNNALNEVCNGVDFSEAEFSTRLGASRTEARRLLRDVTSALSVSPPADE
jgi:hypothetical protein